MVSRRRSQDTAEAFDGVAGVESVYRQLTSGHRGEHVEGKVGFRHRASVFATGKFSASAGLQTHYTVRSRRVLLGRRRLQIRSEIEMGQEASRWRITAGLPGPGERHRSIGLPGDRAERHRDGRRRPRRRSAESACSVGWPREPPDAQPVKPGTGCRQQRAWPPRHRRRALRPDSLSPSGAARRLCAALTSLAGSPGPSRERACEQ